VQSRQGRYRVARDARRRNASLASPSFPASHLSIDPPDTLGHHTKCRHHTDTHYGQQEDANLFVIVAVLVLASATPFVHTLPSLHDTRRKKNKSLHPKLPTHPPAQSTPTHIPHRPSLSTVNIQETMVLDILTPRGWDILSPGGKNAQQILRGELDSMIVHFPNAKPKDLKRFLMGFHQKADKAIPAYEAHLKWYVLVLLVGVGLWGSTRGGMEGRRGREGSLAKHSPLS